jgi:hypothetical protein
MGMYCCCDEKISGSEFECKCNWEGWISIFDWPEERKNKSLPIRLPDKDGKYLVRCTQDGDRYEAEINFTVTPRIVKGSYFDANKETQVHWEEKSWDDESPYAWKEI